MTISELVARLEKETQEFHEQMERAAKSIEETAAQLAPKKRGAVMRDVWADPILRARQSERMRVIWAARKAALSQ
jgi:hypothetical protein